ncbi:MAG: PH domain-containing protein [Gemmatimonadota bacterium]|nr:PH domain-containing protein [Gemmatimonadota bacterium]
MSYLDSELVPGETVVYRARPHWRLYLPALLPLTGLIVSLVSDSRPIAIFFLILTALVAAIAHIAYRSSEFGVTTKRVIIKTGWLKRRTLEMLLSKIENVGVDQGLAARLFGYGSITVTGTGGTHENFRNIARPLEFRKQVQGQIAMLEGRGGHEGGLSPAGIATPGREERECPFCAEHILAKAKLCRFCGREVEPLATT